MSGSRRSGPLRRHQLAASSPVAARSLLAGLGAAVRPSPAARAELTRVIGEGHGAGRALLTDSGTSALVLALQLTAGAGGTVAMPAYGCVDLAAAARRAGVRVRTYDVDPETLGPDLRSLEQCIARGVDVVLVAHVYGYAVDMPGALALARRAGLPVIEDAAQAAGGTYAGVPLGSFGDLVVLSFGRGKGTTSGGGGALLARAPAWTSLLQERERAMGPGAAGWRTVVTTFVQWLLGRPTLYGVPASIPALRLGETVYRAAGEPRAMPAAAVAILRHSLQLEAAELQRRRATASALARAAAACPDVRGIRELPGARGGFLRLPLLDEGGRRPSPELGVLRGYPRTLRDEPEMRPCLHDGEPPMPGAEQLCRTLFTLPTHGLVSAADRARLVEWIGGPGAKARPAREPSAHARVSAPA